MQKIYKVTIALTAFVLMLSIVSLSFTGVTLAAEDANGNRIIFPVPAWKLTGPSPWWSHGDSALFNLSNGAVNPYSTVPKTPHMLWKSQLTSSGVSGGFNPTGGFWTDYGINYPWGDIIVLGGRVYVHGDLAPNEQAHQYACIDEETGEVIWRSDPILGACRWRMNFIQKAVLTGKEGGGVMILDYAGYPSADTVHFIEVTTGKIGYSYKFPRAISLVACGWEDSLTTKYGWSSESAPETYAYGVKSTNARANILYCYKFLTEDFAPLSPPELVWEVNMPNYSFSVNMICEDVIVGRSDALSTVTGINRFTGEVLWVTPFSSWQGNGGFGYGKYFLSGNDNRIYGFDIHTGEITWKSEIASNNFLPQHGMTSGNDAVFMQGYEGVARAFDSDTGKVKWQYYIGDCPYEPYKSWYGTWANNQVPTGGKGFFVCQTGDHIRLNPRVPGERFYVYNATTGKVLWTFSNLGDTHNAGSLACADGMLFAHDTYTGQLRGFGRGPTAVEVSVSQAQVSKGEYTWITGTVTDQSAAQTGTPCVSEKDMGPWMEYLHCGMPMPPTKTGVPITLYAEAATTGKTIEIGTVMTNGETGRFGIRWLPPTEDLYTITGVFMGDSSYWTSYGSTVLAVGATTAATSNTAAMSITSLAAVVVGSIVIQKLPFKKREEIEK